MRGGKDGGVQKQAQDAIATIRNARERLGEGPKFKNVDATAINAGREAPRKGFSYQCLSSSLMYWSTEAPSLVSSDLACGLSVIVMAGSKNHSKHGHFPQKLSAGDKRRF